jgi:uncharacterized SAM-binding protein YcdF (DUF218 family)
MVLVVGLGLVFALVTVRMFLRPASADPERADAVIVLSGDHGDRMAGALKLLQAGVTDVLVHAGAPDTPDVAEMCDRGSAHGFDVVCLEPNPDSTRAEARAVADLARDRGWGQLVLVTSAPHVNRAGTLFRRCSDADVDVVATTPPFTRRQWLKEVAKEWAGTLGVAVRRGC